MKKIYILITKTETGPVIGRYMKSPKYRVFDSKEKAEKEKSFLQDVVEGEIV